MRRLHWVLTLTVLGLASVVSVSAFRSAAVHAGGTATVVSTNAAALALLRGDTDLGRFENGSLVIELQPQQPDSTYEYERVFRIRNNSTQAKSISIATVEGDGISGVHVTLMRRNNDLVLWQGGSNGGVTTNLNPDTALAIDMIVDVDAGAPLGSVNLVIRVDAR